MHSARTNRCAVCCDISVCLMNTRERATLGGLGFRRGAVLVHGELHEQAQVAGINYAAEDEVGLCGGAGRRGVAAGQIRNECFTGSAGLWLRQDVVMDCHYLVDGAVGVPVDQLEFHSTADDEGAHHHLGNLQRERERERERERVCMMCV